jgi:hypothetical protein
MTPSIRCNTQERRGPTSTQTGARQLGRGFGVSSRNVSEAMAASRFASAVGRRPSAERTDLEDAQVVP